MQHEMVNWGPDGSDILCEGNIGFGQMMLHNTPESINESLPIKNDFGNLLLTAAARLDNRKTLFDLLEIEAGKQYTIPDSLLILKAYEKWGVECPGHLLGDWAFAIWDAREKSFFMARDHFGVSSLYYYNLGKTFIFCSSLKGILALQRVPRQLNPKALPGSGFMSDASTPYKKINRLTSAQAIAGSLNSVKCWCYWHLDRVPDIRFKHNRDYLDAFLELYEEAVRCRLRTHRSIGLMLSGGLDSGSIAVLAAKELTKTNQRISAFSSIPLYDTSLSTPRNRCGDERPYIEAICNSIDNIDLTFVNAGDQGILDALKTAVNIHQLPQGSANHTWILDILGQARQKNIGVMLDGWGGNFTVSWNGNRQEYLRDLFLKGNWGRYIHEIRNLRKADQASLFSTLLQMVKPFISPLLIKRYNRFRNAKYRVWYQRPNNIKQVNCQAVEATNSGLYRYFCSGKNVLASELSAAFGMETRQPAMDKRLIEFCLGLPMDQYLDDGYDRMLIRRAMADLMPEKVIWADTRGKRGIQSADIGQRLLDDHRDIQAVLNQFKKSTLISGYLNLERVDHALSQIHRTVNSKNVVSLGNIVVHGLVSGLFLQQFEDD